MGLGGDIMLETRARIELWQVETIRKYLEDSFVSARIDEYARGSHLAHLFTVAEPEPGGSRRLIHYLLVTHGFFERLTDLASLQHALVDLRVARQLRQGAGRTVTLY
jgi:hypothetical protein